jgi:hypothetical protein
MNCPACGSPRSDPSAPCPNCGAVWGQQHKCPHCGGITNVEPHPVLVWRCGACGGPRIPVDLDVARTGKELALLRAGKDAHAGAFGWRAGGIALTVIAVMAILFGGLLALVTLMGGGVIATIGVLSLITAFTLFSRAKKADGAARDKMVEAWAFVAGEVLKSLGREVTAPQLAQAMRTSEAHAEAVLKKLSVDDRVGMRVSDEDAQIYYASRDLPARARVAGAAEELEEQIEEEAREQEEAKRTR